jgi:hypothetical protein
MSGMHFMGNSIRRVDRLSTGSTVAAAAEDRLAWATIVIGAFILVHVLLAQNVVLL